MSIRLRLTLLHTMSVVLLLILLGSTVYFFSMQYRQVEFANRLKARVKLTEQLRLEANRLSPTQYQTLHQQITHFLSRQKEYIFDAAHAVTKDSIAHLFKTSIEGLESFEFQQDSVQGVGQRFEVDGKSYWVVVSAVDDVGWRKLEYLKSILFFGSFMVILSVTILTWWAAGHALRPLNAFIKQTDAINAGNLHERVSLDTPNQEDEIGILAARFNQMMARLQRAFEMQKYFISNASHEIKNPLASILGQAEIALERPRTALEYESALQSIQQDAERMEELVSNFLAFAKTGFDAGQVPKEALRLDELILDLKDERMRRVPTSKIRLDFKLTGEDAESLEVWGNEALLRSALYNLLENACKFSNNDWVDLVLEQDGKHLNIRVVDRGIGIPPKDLVHIQEPLYRAANARGIKGFGLGLALAARIIELHQGNLDITSELGKGTTVLVCLPSL